MFPPLLTLLLHLTCGASAVDDKDITASSNQGNCLNIFLSSSHNLITFLRENISNLLL